MAHAHAEQHLEAICRLLESRASTVGATDREQCARIAGWLRQGMASGRQGRPDVPHRMTMRRLAASLMSGGFVPVSPPRPPPL